MEEKKRIAWNIGRKMSEETRLKLSNSCKGRTPWNKGKECPQLSAPRGPLKNPVWNKTESNVTCAMCGKVFHKKPALVKAAKLHYCSSRCMGDHRKIIYSGANNPFYGKEHPGKGIPRTEEVCNKISEANTGKEFTEEHCMNISDAKKGWVGLCGNKNPMYGKTELMRTAALIQLKKRRSNYLNGKYVYSGINFHSSWEVKFAKLLDSLGLHWEYEEYEYDLGELGVYIPDFFVVEWNMHIEVKGWKSEIGMTKFAKFKEIYDSTALLVDEPMMKHMGLI